MRLRSALVGLSVLSLLLGATACEEKPKESPSTQSAAYTQVAPTASRQALATQEKIVQVEAQKSIELQKINAQTRLKELELQQARELALLKEKERLLRIEHEQAKERYLIFAAIAFMILVGLALLWYFDRRRQDKLIAYKDNLQKYFLFKENETRMKIADKIIDTVSKQEISAEEKAKLIDVLQSPVAEGKPRLPEEIRIEEKPTQKETKLDDSQEEETVIEVEEELEAPDEKPQKPWYRFW